MKTVKDTHRENTPSNKTETLTKNMNMFIWAIGFYTQVKFFKKMK